ncbi:MAG: sigma-54-dependent Fis family transcriptional regulator, partial [Desulfotignum sp.]|nr:sigma-54-dependent Fis family transcriptional regulator [Desulfotignum sp.]
MKDILVLTEVSDDFGLISRVLGDAFTVRHAPDLATAQTLHSQSPFDMIMADISVLENHSESGTFLFSEHPFVAANPFVQFVVLCDKKHLTTALAAVKDGAAGYLL